MSAGRTVPFRHGTVRPSGSKIARLTAADPALNPIPILAIIKGCTAFIADTDV